MHTVIQAGLNSRATATGAANSEGERIRSADAGALGTALHQGRALLLEMFTGFEEGLGPAGLSIDFDPALNPPLWELGHIGWFEEWWLRRNAHWARGASCPPAAARSTSVLKDADALYDSSNVAHASRWSLALPDAAASRAYLAQVRESTLALLAQAQSADDALYFFRLALLHEDMHREAWFMMAQHLGIDLRVALPGAVNSAAQRSGQWSVAAGIRPIGSASGFCFDNELRAHSPFVAAFSIDRSAVCWRNFLPFVESGGYEDARLWTSKGWQWRQAHSDGLPLHVRGGNGAWQQQRFGRWDVLDLDAPAVHVSAHEAAAWCRFAGRRLPSELEFETATRVAIERNEAFDWGRVWEWTASEFKPYAGFAPHPYRDYSAPFFDGRPVLRGGSLATHPRMLHPAYRNYFQAHRRDVFAGFRSCAIDQANE